MIGGGDYQGLPGVSCREFLKYFKPNAEEIEQCRKKGSFQLGVITADSDHEAVLEFNSKGKKPFHKLLDQEEVLKKRLLCGFNFIKLTNVEEEKKAFSSIAEDVYNGAGVTGYHYKYQMKTCVNPGKIMSIDIQFNEKRKIDINTLIKPHNKAVKEAEAREKKKMNFHFDLKPDHVMVDEHGRQTGRILHYFISTNINKGVLCLLNDVLGSKVSTTWCSDNDPLGPVVAPHDVPAPRYYGSLGQTPLTDLNTPLGNLNRFLFEMIGEAEGLTTPWVYFGFKLSPFLFHTEDMLSVNSLNYLVHGACKRWYIIPPRYVKTLEEKYIQTFFDNGIYPPRCLSKHKQVHVTTEQLDEWEIGYYQVKQSVGCVVVTAWSAYHLGFNEGNNCAIAFNLVLADWKMFHLSEINSCLCKKKSSSLGVRVTPEQIPDKEPLTILFSDRETPADPYFFKPEENPRPAKLLKPCDIKEHQTEIKFFGNHPEPINVYPEKSLHSFTRGMVEFGHFCYQNNYFNVLKYWLLTQKTRMEHMDAIISFGKSNITKQDKTSGATSSDQRASIQSEGSIPISESSSSLEENVHLLVSNVTSDDLNGPTESLSITNEFSDGNVPSEIQPSNIVEQETSALLPAMSENALSTSSALYHFKIHATDSRHHCNCGKGVKTAYELTRHMGRANNFSDCKIKCLFEGCKKMFRTVDCMRQHIYVVHKTTCKTIKKKNTNETNDEI